MTAEPVAAELVDQREVLPGQWIDAFHAPAIALAARAGQLVQLLLVDDSGLLVRRAWPINTADASTGVLSLHLDLRGRTRPDDASSGGERGSPGEWTSVAAAARVADGVVGPAGRLRAGDVVAMAGPLGRPFELDPRSHHLLLVAQGAAVSGVRLLAGEAIRDGRQVTLLFGARGARDVYPSTLLPDEIEYVVATEDGSLGQPGTVADLVPAYEAWADQAFAAGPWPLLAQLAGLAAGRGQRMGVAKLGRKRGGGRPDPPGSATARRKAFLQVAVQAGITCAAGTCLGCSVGGAGGGMLRVCREGPVFAADELDWASPS